MTETKNYTAGYRDCAGCLYELQTNREYPCSECREMVGPDYPNRYESKDMHGSNVPKIKETPPMPSQTAKADAGKAQLTLVPRKIIWAIAKVREYGCKKYPEGGVDNWKQVEKERYRDAMMRHMLQYLDDPDGVDEESGLPHLWHLATNCAFLCEMEQDSK